MSQARFSTLFCFAKATQEHSLGLELGYCPQGVRRIQLRGRGFGRRKSRVAVTNPKWLDRLIFQLKRYFNGVKADFNGIPMLLDSLTSLQKKVLKLVYKIPYGTTKSYGEIARALGYPKYARAVGRACRVNPLPILIPCHRVIRTDGKLGGYSQGIKLKKKLLELEGIELGRLSAEK